MSCLFWHVERKKANLFFSLENGPKMVQNWPKKARACPKKSPKMPKKSENQAHSSKGKGTVRVTKSEIPANSHIASKHSSSSFAFTTFNFYFIPLGPMEGVRGWGTGSEVEVSQIIPISRVLVIFAVFWSCDGHFSALFPFLVPFPFELWDRSS